MWSLSFQHVAERAPPKPSLCVHYRHRKDASRQSDNGAPRLGLGGRGRFNARVYVDKVDGARTCGGDDAKIVALWEQGIERTEGIRPRIVATGDVCLGAESRFQWNGWKPVTGLRCHSPCPDICGTEASKLPKRFVIEIPARLRLSNGTRQTRTDAVPHFVGNASVECGCFSIEAKIVDIQRGVHS